MASYNYPADFIDTFWRVLDGDIYVSTGGDNAEGNGSPSLPYQTLAYAVSQASSGDKIVMGAGVYGDSQVEGTVDAEGKNIIIEGDGIVIHAATFHFVNFNASASVLKNLQIIGGDVTGANTGFYAIEDCYIRAQSMFGFTATIRNSVLKSVMLNAATGGVKLYNCTFEDVQVAGTVKEIYDCTFNENCMVTLDSSVLDNFDFCNIEEGAGFYIDGEPTPYQNSAAVHAVFSQYQGNGLSEDPKFNARGIDDFTLQNDSPLLGAGRFRQSIGGRQQAVSKNTLDLSLINSVFTISGMQTLTSPVNSLQLAPAQEEGIVVSQWIDLGKNQKLGTIRLYADNFFEIPPSTLILKNKVEDISFDVRPDPVSSHHGNMVTYGMQYYKEGDPTPMIYYSTFIWGKQPTIDALGRANGQFDFDVSTSRPVVARYVKLYIRITSANYFLTQENTDCLLQEDGSNILWKIN